MVGDLNNNNQQQCSTIDYTRIATRNLKIDKNRDIINISMCREYVRSDL